MNEKELEKALEAIMNSNQVQPLDDSVRWLVHAAGFQTRHAIAVVCRPCNADCVQNQPGTWRCPKCNETFYAGTQ